MDTVELQGKGFTSARPAGDRVRQGDVLAEVDVDYVKRQGKSLVSPVVFTDGGAVRVLKRDVDVTRGDSGILEL